jgi:hypothetical protein
VADSQDFALDANVESMQNLEDNLKRQGIRIREIPMVIQYNKRDLPNALPVPEIARDVNKLNVPSFESVATTGIGVEETLKGITQLVLAHLIKKYGLEGSEPLDREIQILNPNVAPERKPAESIWDEAEEEPGFVLDDAKGDEDLPLVQTELIGTKPTATPVAAQAAPFMEVTDYFSQPAADTTPFPEMNDIPMASVEIPLPEGILSSLPVLDQQTVTAAPPDRRSTDGLVKEISIPLNLTMDEIRQHRRLRLKITLEVNLLP